MKKFILVAFMIICLFSLCACTKEEEHDFKAIDEVFQYIDLLPNKITLKNEEEVNNCLNLYNALKDTDKELVENYNELEFAINKINYLKNETEFIKKEFETVQSNILSKLPDEVESTVFELELIKQYTSKNEYASYLMNLTWSSSDEKTISALNGAINHANVDKEVTLTCKVTCSNTKDVLEFSKTILVKKQEFNEFGKQVVTAYYYGNYEGLTELDYKTLDMVIYCFSDISSKEQDGKTIYYVSGNTNAFDQLKEARNKGVRVLFSLGGWHDDKAYWETYQKCAASEESRKQIAQSILEYLEKYHLDGIDMDWEYPRSADKNNYTLLMKEIYITLKTANPNYIVSAAIPCGTSWVSSSFDLAQLNNYLDFLNLMSYDLDDGKYTTNHTAYMQMINGLNYFVKAGFSANKIVCGAAFYGRIFYDVSNKSNGLGQTYSSKASITFRKISENYLSRLDNGVTKYIDFTNKAYYLYDENEHVFISYDDPQAIQQKCMYSYENGYGGIMFWSYKEDDKNQTLMNAIYEYYHSVNIK